MREQVLVHARQEGGITVGCLMDENDQSQVRDFLDELATQQPADHAKTMALLDRISQAGELILRNPEKCKPVEEDIKELRPTKQVRILFFRHPTIRNYLVCVSAERKKRDDLDPTTIRRAQQRLREIRTALGLPPR